MGKLINLCYIKFIYRIFQLFFVPLIILCETVVSVWHYVCHPHLCDTMCDTMAPLWVTSSLPLLSLSLPDSNWGYDGRACTAISRHGAMVATRPHNTWIWILTTDHGALCCRIINKTTSSWPDEKKIHSMSPVNIDYYRPGSWIENAILQFVRRVPMCKAQFAKLPYGHSRYICIQVPY